MLDVRKIRLTLELRQSGISNSEVVSAIEKIPREIFIPKTFRHQAYENIALPIGEEQTISQPYIVALMTELLKLNGNEKILEIGTGSGYQAAVLSPLAKEVYSVEIIKSLADKAANKLQKMHYNNVTVKWGDGYQGWVEHAPFDAIIVTAAPDNVPQALIDQIKIGSKLVVPVGTYFQKLKVITKIQDGLIEEENIASVRFVPMVHSKKTPRDNTKLQKVK